MDDSKNWHELIDSLFNWYHGDRLWKDPRPFLDNELHDAPYEAQVYAIKKFLSATHTYATDFNYLIDYIPDKYLSEIAEAAIIAAETEAPEDRVIDAINQISDQQPTALYPYLDRLFEVMTHQDRDFGYRVQGAWRGASNIDGLKAIIDDKQLPNEIRAKACECVLETRQPEAIHYVIKQIEMGQVDMPSNLENTLLWLGYEWDGANLRQLYSDAVYHLIFQQGYRLISTPEYLKHVTPPEHPTYHLDTSHAKQLAFGGVTENICWICQKPLHHVITIEPELTGLPIHNRKQVELVTCLSCPDWETKGLYYRHNEQGKAESIPHGEPSRTLDMNSPGFMPTEVALVRTPSRWRWQATRHNTHDVNLTRLGGNPYWLQFDEEYLDCPECGKRMDFLMQLMDGLPEANGKQQAWGDTGMGYFFWCDACAISGFVSVTY